MSDLNRRAAEAMGWRYCQCDSCSKYNTGVILDQDGEYLYEGDDFDPCNRIEHAWMLVEWLVKEGYSVEVQAYEIERVEYNCAIDDGSYMESVNDHWVTVYDTTAPLAITRAFLEAVGDSEQVHGFDKDKQ